MSFGEMDNRVWLYSFGDIRKARRSWQLNCRWLAACGFVVVLSLVLVLHTHQSTTILPETGPPKLTYLRARLKSAGRFLTYSQNKSEPITETALAHLLPDDVTMLSFPEDFFKCRPARILRATNNYNDLSRFSGCGAVFYNRVPKCGSRTVGSVIRVLGQRYNYTVSSLVRPRGISYMTSTSNLIKFGLEFAQLQEPFVYIQHLHFVNFTQLGIRPPIYINVLRDPVDRAISHYYYNRFGSGTTTKNNVTTSSLDHCVESTDCCKSLPLHQILPYFCGQATSCRYKRKEMLQRAKRTVWDSYLVVGLTEDLPAFFNVLEILMPSYFSNATDVFTEIAESMRNKTKTANKREVSKKTRQKLQDMLHLEYSFYTFVRQRFYTLKEKIRSLTLDRDMGWT